MTIIPRIVKLGTFVNTRIFGRQNLLVTNALISTSMGFFGDFCLQNFDILSVELNKENKNEEKPQFNYVRSSHMSMAGLTTGMLTHYWYIVLDKYMGRGRTIKLVIQKVLVDQIMFSPINLVCYFGTVGILEGSNFKHILQEIKQKGMENIYLVEWAIWPPAQMINFYLLPMRYRILFDNVVSFFFDIYSPYIKYKTDLKEESPQKKE